MRSLPTLVFLISLVLPILMIAQPDCGYNPDYNGDNEIGVPDLLGLLSLFEEQDSDDDGIWDSQDDCIGVEDPCGVCNGTGTDNDADGICDDIDECVGFYDEDGNCVGGPEECGGASTVDFNGYTYNLVAIGDQCWFAENLRTEHYANGDSIPGNLSVSEWIYASTGAQTVYGEGSIGVYGNGTDEVANLATYGRLYNWYAVADDRGLCPNGWHVPTDHEWMILEMELGMSSSEANSSYWRGTDQGAQMKSSPSDAPSWNGTNASDFSALPGGLRYSHNTSSFNAEGSGGFWWSATPDGSSEAWQRHLTSDGDNVYRFAYGRRYGFSVRCILD